MPGTRHIHEFTHSEVKKVLKKTQWGKVKEISKSRCECYWLKVFSYLWVSCIFDIEMNFLAFSGKLNAFKVPLTTKPVGIYFQGCIYWNIMQKQHTWAALQHCGGRGDTCDSAGRNRLLVDPEGDLWQHHNHDERDVGLDEVVAQLPLQVEVDHLHRVVTCKTKSMC